METEHPDCIFCNPAAGTEICRNADGIVVLAGPARPGHVLVGILDHRPSLRGRRNDEACCPGFPEHRQTDVGREDLRRRNWRQGQALPRSSNPEDER